MMNISFEVYLFKLRNDYLHVVKHFDMGPTTLLSIRRNFIALNNSSPWQHLNMRTLGIMASTLTIVRFQVLTAASMMFSPDDGGSTHLWNVGGQSFYTAVQPRRQLWTLTIPPPRRISCFLVKSNLALRRFVLTNSTHINFYK
jgi:hypothetical protein